MGNRKGPIHKSRAFAYEQRKGERQLGEHLDRCCVDLSIEMIVDYVRRRKISDVVTSSYDTPLKGGKTGNLVVLL
jgi:hypothetical protein